MESQELVDKWSHKDFVKYQEYLAQYIAAHNTVPHGETFKVNNDEGTRTKVS